MNLSRAAKKFRDQTPKKGEGPKPANAKKEKVEAPPAPTPEPVPQPVQAIVPTPEPVAPAPAEVAEPIPPAQHKKARSEKVKRPRFVREKAEKRERPVAGPVLPPRSTKFTAQLLTKHLAVPPTEDPKAGR